MKILLSLLNISFGIALLANAAEAQKYDCIGKNQYWIDDQFRFEEIPGEYRGSFYLSENEMRISNGRTLKVRMRKSAFGVLYAETSEGTVAIFEDGGGLVFTWNLGALTAIGTCINISAFERLLGQAENGSAEAQYELYLEIRYGQWGWHKIKDKKSREAEAIKWLELAAEQGHASAQHELAMVIGSKNTEESQRLTRLAAQQGLMLAIATHASNLSYFHEDHEGAARWLRQGATTHPVSENFLQDQKMVQYNLGVYYLKGLGVPQDYQSAYMWFLISDFSDANDFISEAERNLSPEEIIEAARRAIACKESRYRECN